MHHLVIYVILFLINSHTYLHAYIHFSLWKSYCQDTPYPLVSKHLSPIHVKVIRLLKEYLFKVRREITPMQVISFAKNLPKQIWAECDACNHPLLLKNTPTELYSYVEIWLQERKRTILWDRWPIKTLGFSCFVSQSAIRHLCRMQLPR